jgi:TonB-linked SusC/RagA family outer membrane protein
MDKHRKVNFFAVLFFLSLFCCFSIQGQEQKVAVNLKNASLKEVFSVIEKQTSYRFSYRSAAIDNRKDINVQKSGVSVTTVLDEALKGRDLEYKIVSSKMIVISNKVTNKAIPSTKQKRVSGVITDTKGEPIIGANVAVKGTSNGTITDIDGKFDIEVPANTTLKISYIGYQPMEINIGNKSTIDIKLSEDTQALDEIVVVGYGTQKKSDVSGSVTTVSGEKLAKIPTANAETALQGMAPGLSVNFGSGSAGSTGTLQVRGVTTWGTDNSPLVIIDGVPGDMSYLNPEDIKSMSVLKDAATAAIYGARAAAGVILIETNRGTVQAPRIQFSAYLGMDDLPKRMEVCNSAEFVKVRKMALSNAGIAESRWPKYISAYEKDPTQFADTDWQKEYYRRGLTQKYNVGYTSGNEVTNVALSTFYSKTDAIVIGTGDTKYGFRLNSDVKRGNFKMGESVSYSRWESDLEASSGFPSMYQVTNIEPLAFVYDKNNDGGYGGAIAGMGMSDAANVVGYNKLVENTAANDYIAASGYLQYEPIKDLVLKFKASRNIYFGSSRNFTPTYELGVMKVNNRASLYEERTKTMSDLLEFTANWNKTFLQKHSVQALFGMSQEENRYDGINASGKKFENNEMSLLGQAQEDFAIGGTKTRSGLRSVFGRLNYNYLMRYMIMASCRYDGSSRFADGNKWGVFPSVSAGWNIANEPFWGNMKETVSTLKLRLSYGGLGNQSIGLYKYIPKLSSNTDYLNYPFGGKDVSLGYAITELPSSNIKWETTIYKNVGIDVGLWNNKLELSAEAYIKNTKDMLSTKNISLCTGFGSLTVNDGKLRTTGFEMQAIYHGNAGKLKYDLDMNLTHYKSVLKSMADPNYLYEYGAMRTYVGGEIGEFWVVKTDGIFQSAQEVTEWNKTHGYYDKNNEWHGMQPSAKPGDIKFIDQNGDGMLDSSDKVKVGSGTPKVALAFNVNLTYGDFDLVANFYGHFGVKRYNYTKYQLQRMDQVFNYGKDALNAWTPENTDTDVPRAVQGDPNKNNRVSDRYVENGDYLRLNNLQLGYNLPASTCHSLGISNLRVYIGGERLFTITGYKGYDPSTGSTVGRIGYDYASTPLSRTYMAGIKFSF